MKKEGGPGVTNIYYGFLDEAGGADPFSGSHFLVVAVLTTNVPRPIELHVKRARKSLGRKARPDETKAAVLEERVIERLLRSLADEDVEIVAVIVDKRAILRRPDDPEDIYREAVTRAIVHCVKRWPRIELFLDKRYTKESLRYELERVIREGIAGLPQEVVLIRQEDSRSQKGLQAVDHVAWAIFQKYEAGDNRFYSVIKDKIVVEEVVRHHLW
ncbi:MAG: DUF3800 domain-containing protein [Deltaproteobacteria bacterium]|nr:DUF3800 domain-containing protein [Deltaproteobacteria bacterium]